MKRLLPALLLVSLPLHAEIFMCDDNGHKTYSQQPCGKNAASVTLENQPRQITIPDVPDEAYAQDFCGLAVSAFDMAVSRQHDRGRRNYYNSGTVSQVKIASYLRERISNYQEKSREGPQVDYMIEQVSGLLYRLALSANQQSPLNMNLLRDSCNDAARRLINERKPLPSGRRTHAELNT